MQEMKESNEKSTSGVYGGDVPDELCYQWAEEYFNDLNVPEDKDENDKEFMPRLYTDKNSSKSKEKPAKKTAETKPPEKANEQMTLFGTEGVQ